MASGRTLYDVYKNPSREKRDAWERIEREIQERKGYNVCVSGSTYSFSVTYLYLDNEDIIHRVYITPSNYYDTKVYDLNNIKAVYNESAFSAWVILDILYGVDDKIVSAFYYGGQLSGIKRTKFHYTPSGRAYIVRYGKKLYIDNFVRTDV